MFFGKLNYIKIKKKYLKFLKSQEVLSEPFRDKIDQLNNFYIPISKKIAENYFKDKKTKVIGLTGSQGSGKSTISQILKIILKEGFNLNTVTFSIDDFYKTLYQRKEMSYKVSPLFLTRGVPGTHDVKLLNKCLSKLKLSKFRQISIPKFDKANDDRMQKKKWQKINKKPNIIIFEGWCVGVNAQKSKDLVVPVNTLEREKDKKRNWRKRVNKELKKDYKTLFRFIDYSIFLKVPSFKYVYKWRLLQEKKLKSTSSGKKTMTNKQIRNFIMFYERLTKHMLKTYHKVAEIVINIDKKHRLKSIKFN